MKNHILNIFKENLIIKISFFFILVFPILLLIGSAILNISIFMMNILFLIHIFYEKKLKIFNNDVFYILIAIWVFFIINTLLNDNFSENYSRSFGFLRFILLVFSFSYFVSYKNNQFKKFIFNIWTIIFIIISLDLIFELIFGFNTFGFKSPFPGRLTGFMGDELKIGHWYLCFSLIILSNNFNNHRKFYFLLLLIIAISFFIGERANFIRLTIAIVFLLLITRRLSFKSLGGLVIMCVIVFNYTDNNNYYKARYMQQIKNAFKHNSLREMNENNEYTPMYINAYNLFKDNKLLGVGLGSYYKKSHEKFNKSNNIINGYRVLPNTHPHQYHFEIMATLGLPGYMLILSFLFYFFKKNLHFYKLNRQTINLSSSLMILVFFIPFLPTGSFFTTYGATIFWLNFSLMNLGNIKNINY